MYIYTIKINDKQQQIVSLLAPEEVNDKGLPSPSILGTLLQNNSQDINLNNFVPNSNFIDFLHSIIAKFAPNTSGINDEAKRQKNGWIYIIDARHNKQRENVLTEDIIGAFEVNEGEIKTESYQRNNNHLIFSQNGFFKLEPSLQKHLIEETRKLVVACE
jgi:hypothetical protein